MLLVDLINDAEFRKNSADKLLTVLKNKKPELLKWIGVALTDMKDCEMMEQNWQEFIDHSKEVIIIRKTVEYSKQENPIFDMLLAKFYNFQMNQHDMSIDIIIDELKYQNTVAESPIHSIVTNARKAHTAFIGATQDYKKGSSINDTMGQANIQIFLKPTSASEDDVADVLRYGKKKRNYFDGMDTGDAIIKADVYSTEKERNYPTILCGKICRYEESPISNTTRKYNPRSEYVGNVR